MSNGFEAIAARATKALAEASKNQSFVNNIGLPRVSGYLSQQVIEVNAAVNSVLVAAQNLNEKIQELESVNKNFDGGARKND